MRVGLVCPYSVAAPGGVQNHLRSLVPALRSRGVDATILAPTDGPLHGAVHGDVKGAGAGIFGGSDQDAPVTSLGRSLPVPANGSIARIGLDPRGIRRLVELRGGFDVIHVHEPLVPGVALAASLQREVPTVGTFHAAGERYWPYLAFGQITRFPLGTAWRRLDVRTAVSEAAANRVRPYFGNDLEIVPNGFDYARFAGAAPVAERADVDGPVILFLGRDEPRKGLDVAVGAFRDVRRGHPDAELWVAGPGTDTVSGAGVRAFGAVDDATLASLYASADVFCAPARFGESFGIVLLEAMAAGAAVVASSIEGYAAVARDGREAVLVEPGDVPGFVRAIERVLGDPDLAPRLVEAGRRRAAEYDWELLAGRVIGLYERADAR